MAKKNIEISEEKNFEVSGVASRILSKSFGRIEDYIELHIYDRGGNLLYSEENFSNFQLSTDQRNSSSAPNVKEDLSSEINMDPVGILRDRGYTSGKYKLSFNIQRKKIVNSLSKIFTLKEISSTRTELRAISKVIQNSDLERSIRTTINEINSNPFYKDIILNFGEDKLVTCVNMQLNKRTKKYEILFKLPEPLLSSISTLDTFRVTENIVDKINLNVDLGFDPIEDNRIPLRGPNFKVDVRLNNSVPSAFKNYNDILSYNATSSYQQLLNQLENKEVPEIDYTFIKSTHSASIDKSYHFENFTHFSSATERLKNFEYKLKLIELYDDQIADISAIPGPTSASSIVLTDKNNINTKKENLLRGLDGYERFLYYTTGSVYTWPKQNSTYPYILYSVTSSQAKTWLGDDRSNYPNYGGQLLSASLFDNQNIHKISNLLPAHIVENPDNDNFSLFTNMIGQQFDHIWTHIKHITEINDTHHTRGISKDLVYFQLKSLGLETFDQFENSNLIEYILGKSQADNTVGGLQIGSFTVGGNDSNFYDTVHNETLVTASNEGSVPKQDITKNIWKRLYHNAPYLLKTKGTERGLRALMSCYGIPSTLLNVKEYGGSTSDKSTFKTFSYEKSGLALKGDSGTNGYFLKTQYPSESISPNNLGSTIEFRLKPARTTNDQIILTLSGSTLNGTYSSDNDHIITLDPYTGNDINKENDSTQYGRLSLTVDEKIRCSTDYFPIYNGDFWNINLSAKKRNDLSDSIATSSLTIGARQANFNKNVSLYTASADVSASNFWNSTWGHKAGDNGFKYVYLGGLEPNSAGSNYNTYEALSYSGSIQEVRYYIGEILLDSTFKNHALEPFMYAGNTISSSFDNLVFRAPLGSNDQQTIGGSFHPNQDINYINSVESSMTTSEWEEVVETHHLPTPDTVGASMTSEKVRLDTGTIDDDILSIIKKSETSALDRQPQDFEDLGVFFSPTTELNEDIVYQLGAFRMDDYIGSPLPSTQTADNYNDLKTIKDIYFKRVKRRYNYWDYTKLIQYIDHTLFKLIEQWVPMKANLKTGLLIEPHYLERNKFARELPVVDYGITMTEGSYQTLDFQIDPEKQFTLGGSSVITTNNVSPITSSKTGRKLEVGTNVTIDIDDYILDEKQNISQAPIRPYTVTKPDNYVERKSNILLGNATKGKKSRIYYRSLDKGKEFDF